MVLIKISILSPYFNGFASDRLRVVMKTNKGVRVTSKRKLTNNSTGIFYDLFTVHGRVEMPLVLKYFWRSAIIFVMCCQLK